MDKDLERSIVTDRLNGLTVSALAKKYHIAPNAIVRAGTDEERAEIKKVYLKNRSRFTADDVRGIIEERIEKRTPLEIFALRFNCTKMTIHNEIMKYASPDEKKKLKKVTHDNLRDNARNAHNKYHERLDLRALSKNEVLEIRRLAADGGTCTELAKKFECSRSTINYIVRRKTYREL